MLSTTDHKRLFTDEQAMRNAVEDAHWIRDHSTTPICRKAFRILFKIIYQTYLDACMGEHEAMRLVDGKWVPAAPHEPAAA